MLGRGVQVTTPALVALAERGVDVSYLSRGGRFLGKFSGAPNGAARLRLAQAAWATDFDLAVLNIASTGNVVLVERLDSFNMNGKPIKVPVVGVFECDSAGKFTAWRDYFDWDAMMQQVANAGIDTSAAETEQRTPAPE